MNSQTKKMTALTAIFYGITASAAYLLEKISPSGPCTPGLGVIIFLLAVPVAIILLCINLYKIIMGETEHIDSAIVHVIVIAVVMIFGV